MANYSNTYTLKLDKSDFDSKLSSLSTAYIQATSAMETQSRDLLSAKQALSEVERQKNAELQKGTQTVSAVNKQYKQQLAIAKSLVAYETQANNAHKQNISNINQQIASTKSLASSQNLLADSVKAEYAEQKRSTIALKDKYGVTSKAETAARKYAQALREITNAERTGLITAKESALAIKNANAARQADIQSTKESIAYRNTAANALVRNIRKVESLIVAFYGLKKSYDYTLGVGQEFNKMMEAEQIGIALSITQKLKDVDVTGKQVTAMEKWQFANKQAAKEMEEVRKINVFTPHSLGETIQLYKVISGQVRTANGTMEDSLTITKQLSILASAGNVEFQSLLKTTDQLFSGNMKPSDMQMALQNIVGLSQEGTREALKQGKVLEYIKEKLKGVEIASATVAQTWGGVTSNFTNAWTDIFATLQKPMFEMMKEEMRDATVYLLANKDSIIKGFQEFGSAVASVAEYWDELVVAYLAFSAASKLSAIWDAQKALMVYDITTKKAVLSTRALTIAKTALAAAMSPVGVAVIALTTAYAAYSWWADDVADKEERIEKAMRHSKETLKQLSDVRLAAAKIGADEAVVENQKEIDKVLANILDTTEALARYAYNEEIVKAVGKEKILLQEKLELLEKDKVKRQEQLGIINEQITAHGTNKGAIDFMTSGMSQFTAETYTALEATSKLKYSLITMAESFNKIINESRVLGGEMTSDAARVNQAHLEYKNTLTKEIALKKELATMRTEVTDDPEAKIKQTELYQTKTKEWLQTTIDLHQKQNDYKKLNTELSEKSITLQETAAKQTIKSNELALRGGGDKLAQDNATLATAKATYDFEVKRINLNSKNLNPEEKTLALKEAKLKMDEAEVVSIEKVASASEKASKAKTTGANKEKAERDRAERELDRASKAQLETLKEEQKQKLLLAKIDAGVTGLSKIEEQKLTVKFLNQELVAQKKIVDEAKKMATTPKLEAQYQKEKTRQLEIQLDLIGEQATVFDDIFKNLKDSLSDFSSSFAEGGMAGLGESIKGFADGAIDTMKSSGDPMMMAVGYGAEILQGLFNTKVSQAEIDASKGRVDFSDESLKNLESVFGEAQYPMLEVTNKMYGHLRNMDANFYSIARAMSADASAGGVDLTGANFVDTQSSTFLGFSSESSSLLGTGLNFELQNLRTMMDASALSVKSYTTSLETETSWFGFSSDESIKEVVKNLPSGVSQDMAGAFADGYEMIMTAGVSLGLNEADLSAALLATKVAIGKIDFTGLSDEEVANRLSQAYSTYFSDVITGVDDFSVLISRYGQNTEEALATLGRIAVEYDQSSHIFGLIGKIFTDGIADIETSYQVITQVASGSRWSRVIENVTTTFVNVAEGIYTAQMQMLDIVESAGGLTTFQDAMSAYMSGFFTETEQLDFLTKSMNQSFTTLPLEEMGYVIPKTDAEFRTLLETMDTSTVEGAKLYGQTLLLAEGFNQMTDASDSLAKAIQAVIDASNANIKTYEDSFKNEQQLAEDMALILGVGVVTTIDELNSLFENLKGGVDGLTDSELAFLTANKSLIESNETLAKAEAQKLADEAQELADANTKAEQTLIDERTKMMQDMIKSVSNAWLENLSYLTLQQKTEYASGYLALASGSNGMINSVEAARVAAETAMKSTATKEQYIPVFERYISELEKQAPESTLDDVVGRLDTLIERVVDLEYTTRKTA